MKIEKDNLRLRINKQTGGYPELKTFNTFNPLITRARVPVNATSTKIEKMNIQDQTIVAKSLCK